MTSGVVMPPVPQQSRVLIVDDDEVIARAVFEHLDAIGFTVDLATDADEAERLLQTQNYAVVLMDAYLTGHLSPRAIRLVDRVCRLSPDAYVVVLTAYGSAQLEQSLAQHSRLTILAKPKSVAFIAELIEGLLPPANESPKKELDL